LNAVASLMVTNLIESQVIHLISNASTRAGPRFFVNTLLPVRRATRFMTSVFLMDATRHIVPFWRGMNPNHMYQLNLYSPELTQREKYAGSMGGVTLSVMS
jgi:hypothetical protein